MENSVEHLFVKLKGFVENEEWAQGVAVCDQVLKTPNNSNDADALRSKVICLLRLDRYADALAVCNAATNVNFQFEKAYALYRLQRLEEALQGCPDDDTSPGMAHLRAQILYRMGNYDQCSSIYSKLMDESSGTDADLKTNTYAAFTSAGKAQEVLQDYPIHESETVENFELQFNLASAHIATGDLQLASTELTKAIATVDQVLAEDSIAEERAPMELQLGYIHHKSQQLAEAMRAYDNILKNHKGNRELSAVAANNLAALRGDKDLPDSLRRLRSTISKDAEAKLSHVQLRAIRYNRCLLLLLMRKADECLHTLDGLQEQYGKSARAEMIRAAAYAHLNRWQDCDQVIDQASNEYQGDSAVDEIRLLKAQTLINRGDMVAAAAILEEITNLQATPALVSALVALYGSIHDQQRVIQVLENARNAAMQGIVDENVTANLISKVASVYESMGMGEEASEAYKQILNSASLDPSERLLTVARLVCVLSKIDVEDADRQVSHLPQVFADNIVAEELENAELLRPRTRAVHVQESKATEKPKRTMTAEQKARKRAKAKAKYLAKLEQEGKYDPQHPKFPDPERWVSRKQRSFGRRGRKHRAKFTGAQGSGDGAQKDSARLDAAKRAAEAKAREAEAKPTKGRRRAKK